MALLPVRLANRVSFGSERRRQRQVAYFLLRLLLTCARASSGEIPVSLFTFILLTFCVWRIFSTRVLKRGDTDQNASASANIQSSLLSVFLRQARQQIRSIN